jgi:anti-sigma factor RsiW
VLDQLLDTESEVLPKPAARADDAEDSIRHLTPEDLKAYAHGLLTSARLSYCQAHLDSCEECREELEDLRTVKSDLSAFPRPEPNRGILARRQRRRGLTLPQVGLVAVIFVAVAVATVLWWARGSLPVKKSPVVAAVAQTPTPPPPAPAMPTRDTRVADEIAALPDDLRSAVSEAIQRGKLQLPPDVSRLRTRGPNLPAASEATKGFALLGPFGETISDTRPEFTWQPLAGAIGYSVVIVDAGLHPVQRSPALRTTAWQPRRHLRRGRTYLWEVTATLHGGSKVVASQPSTSETHLRIVGLKLADEIAHFRQGHPEAHLVLGALYAQAGMLTKSADELTKVPAGDSSYNTARKLLASLSSDAPH